MFRGIKLTLISIESVTLCITLDMNHTASKSYLFVVGGG